MLELERTDILDQAQKKYFEAEQMKNPASRRTLFLQAAELYLSAAEEFASIDESTRASFVFLSILATKRADSEILPSTFRSETSSKTNWGEISSHNNRAMAFSTLRTQISGVRKVPKSNPPTSQSLVHDMFILQSKLNDLGISKEPLEIPTYPPISLSSPNDLMVSKHLSSALGESFMLLNQSMQVARGPMNDKIKIKDRIVENLPEGTSLTNTKSKALQPVQSYSDFQQQPSSSKPVGPNHGQHWGVLNFLGFASPGSGDKRSEGIDDIRLRSNQIVENLDASMALWNKGVSLDRSVNQSLFKRPSPNSSLNAAADFNSRQNTSTDSALLDQVLRLQRTIKRLHDENVEMHEKITSQAHITEQNKNFRRDIEVFKQEYSEKFEKLKQTLSDFASRYPSKENPANAVLSQRLDKLNDPEPTGSMKSVAAALASLSSEDNSDAIKVNKNQISSGMNDSERIAQLEILVQRLLTKNERLKAYEEFYKKQRAKAEKKKSETPNAGFDMPAISSPIGSSPAFALPRRPVAAKHPSTSTLETSLHRKISNHFT